jgi:endonuclease/exonuclease/phosphatase (EEP) superfamily protein YafD
VKGYKKICQENGKQLGVAILISEKKNRLLRKIRKDKQGHFILINVTIHQEDITTINIHSLIVSISNFIKQTLLDMKAQTDPIIIIVGDFNIPRPPIGRSSRQKDE